MFHLPHPFNFLVRPYWKSDECSVQLGWHFFGRNKNVPRAAKTLGIFLHVNEHVLGLCFLFPSFKYK